ncbi:MAG: AAA family ATPase [Oligoflexus sp.]
MTSSNPVHEFYHKILHSLEPKHLIGQSELVKLLTVAWLSRGHVLIEGPPGTGKTLAARLFAKVIGRQFKRVQFTSDLLPGDIIGSHLYSQKDQDFHFIPGPVFTDILLADEINRCPPRTQSALLEAMEEKQVTTEGVTRQLSPHFFVIATQNSLDFEGTFPLPEAQMDRFLFKILIDHYPGADEEQILQLGLQNTTAIRQQLTALSETIDEHALDEQTQSVEVSQSLLHYVSELLQTSRKEPSLDMGSSIRGGLALLRCARVLALLEDRNFIIPDDIKFLAKPVLRHRLRLGTEAQLSGTQIDHVIDQLLQGLEFPK